MSLAQYRRGVQHRGVRRFHVSTPHRRPTHRSHGSSRNDRPPAHRVSRAGELHQVGGGGGGGGNQRPGRFVARKVWARTRSRCESGNRSRRQSLKGAHNLPLKTFPPFLRFSSMRNRSRLASSSNSACQLVVCCHPRRPVLVRAAVLAPAPEPESVRDVVPALAPDQAAE